MMIDRKHFFDAIRPALFGDNLSQSQVDGMDAIIDEWERRNLSDVRWLAYILATAYHEVGRTMQPVREGFKRTDTEARSYVKGNGERYAVSVNGRVYYGRGLVQLTWLANYKAMSEILGIDLIGSPDLALQLPIAVKIMFEGMIRGTFTGYRLADYLNSDQYQYYNARRIVNGLDQATKIAAYAVVFEHAILASPDAVIPPLHPAEPIPLPVAPVAQPSVWTRIWNAIVGIFTTT
jgi:hypothetical protein